MRERRNQVRALLRLISSTPTTTVVMGDFNDWLWVGSVRKALASQLPARSRQRTFPAICPLFRFDRIYCRRATALVSTYTDKTARNLSDHLPVLAEIQLFRSSCLGKGETVLSEQ